MTVNQEEKILAYAELAEHKTNHVLHLILTLLTFGFWSWIWLYIAGENISKRNKIKASIGLPVQGNWLKWWFYTSLALAMAVFLLAIIAPAVNDYNARALETVIAK